MYTRSTYHRIFWMIFYGVDKLNNWNSLSLIQNPVSPRCRNSIQQTHDGRTHGTSGFP